MRRTQFTGHQFTVTFEMKYLNSLDWTCRSVVSMHCLVLFCHTQSNSGKPCKLAGELKCVLEPGKHVRSRDSLVLRTLTLDLTLTLSTNKQETKWSSSFWWSSRKQVVESSEGWSGPWHVWSKSHTSDTFTALKGLEAPEADPCPGPCSTPWVLEKQCSIPQATKHTDNFLPSWFLDISLSLALSFKSEIHLKAELDK